MIRSMSKLGIFWIIVFLSMVLITIDMDGDKLKGIVFYEKDDFLSVGGKVDVSRAVEKSGFKTTHVGYQIEYTFNVEGRVYRSDMITFSDNFTDLNYLEKYPVGQHVKVYFDKSNPQFSVLEPETKTYWIFKRIIAWFCGLVWAVYYFVTRTVNNYKDIKYYA